MRIATGKTNMPNQMFAMKKYKFMFAWATNGAGKPCSPIEVGHAPRLRYM
jgi:hypothetical protein